MYHSDLRREIEFLQAQLNFKRAKLSELLKQERQPDNLRELYQQIMEVEQKLQTCFEEQRTQSES